MAAAKKVNYSEILIKDTIIYSLEELKYGYSIPFNLYKQGHIWKLEYIPQVQPETIVSIIISSLYKDDSRYKSLVRSLKTERVNRLFGEALNYDMNNLQIVHGRNLWSGPSWRPNANSFFHFRDTSYNDFIELQRQQKISKIKNLINNEP
jgi:hypothetical protein